VFEDKHKETKRKNPLQNRWLNWSCSAPTVPKQHTQNQKPVTCFPYKRFQHTTSRKPGALVFFFFLIPGASRGPKRSFPIMWRFDRTLTPVRGCHALHLFFLKFGSTCNPALTFSFSLWILVIFFSRDSFALDLLLTELRLRLLIFFLQIIELT